MLTFDKLKLIAKIEDGRIIKDEYFTAKVCNDFITSKRYVANDPYELSIEFNYTKRELIIEFTGKILGHDYPKLISMDTIKDCFAVINSLGFVEVDDEAMMDAEVVMCDVTKDVEVADYSAMTNYIRSHISNYQKYVCNKKRNGNLIIETNTSGKYLLRLTIYDKERQMNFAKNKIYMEEYGLTDEFKGMARYEMSLRSSKQIRERLRIENNTLQEVLTSTANPITEFIEKAVAVPDKECNAKEYKDFVTDCVLMANDYDLARIEAKIRETVSSRGTSIKDKMKRYRDRIEVVTTEKTSSQWNDVLSKLKD